MAFSEKIYDCGDSLEFSIYFVVRVTETLDGGEPKLPTFCFGGFSISVVARNVYISASPLACVFVSVHAALDLVCFLSPIPHPRYVVFE